MSVEDIQMSTECKEYLLAFANALDTHGIGAEHRDAFVGDVANLFLQGVPLDAFETPEEFAFKLAGFLSGEGGCCGGGGGCGGGGCGCGGH